MSIIIGIDFGTTRSGIAYLEPAHQDVSLEVEASRIGCIAEWQNGRTIPKLPSKVAYLRGGNVVWGTDAEDKAGVISMLKLLLLEDEDNMEEILDYSEYKVSKAQLNKLNKNAVEVAGDYLRELWNKFVRDFDRQSYGSNALDRLGITLIFTVPAIWPEYYRDSLLKAARAAGILEARRGLPDTKCQFVTEPEAAAYKTLQDNRFLTQLSMHDTFLVLDCGGATIDAITYQVTKTAPMAVKEAIPGEGALFGGCILDNLFMHALKNKMAAIKAPYDENDPLTRRNILVEWEHKIKGAFTGHGDLHFEAFSLGGASLRFTATELRAIFDPVMAGIHTVVQNQLDALKAKGLPKPNFIRLAGGFGLSLYLYETLHEKFALGKGINISQDYDNTSWSAIARGAVLFGLAGRSLVTSRALREGFALVQHPVWDDNEHHDEDAEFDEVRDTMVARDQLYWFFKKGEDVEAFGFREIPYDYHFKKGRRGIKIWHEPIYRSSRRTPPNRLATAKTDDETFHKHATMQFQTPVPVQDLPVRRGAHVLSYRLRIGAVSGRSVQLDAVWDHDDTVIGTAVMAVRSQ
ncbi:hypothetical protein Micbo1qcDRAFT_203148 [Microdochium bolleyi]|uniref:Actin-like ATPase domain-containing protein n=1 Tax=Microdochium bolleyi TaxID=196109 RepID=A0A136J749_9PEZI|nr:hypothetical protein Micbo1qcDRAFT_203148 [Microdochium bolleyi]